MDAESTRPSARPLAHPLAMLTYSLAPHCSTPTAHFALLASLGCSAALTCSRAPLHQFVCSLALSRAPELKGIRYIAMNEMRQFQTVSTHCAAALVVAAVVAEVAKGVLVIALVTYR